MHVLLHLESATYTLHIPMSCFFIHYDNLCLFIGVFGLLILNITIYMLEWEWQSRLPTRTSLKPLKGLGEVSITFSGMTELTPHSAFSDSPLVGDGRSDQGESGSLYFPLGLCGIWLEKSGYFLSFYLVGYPFPSLLARE